MRMRGQISPASEGRKRVVLSARELSIAWGDSPQCWRWTSVPDWRVWFPPLNSRSSEAAELLDVRWLEIRGKIPSRLLSPKTAYVARLVFKLSEDSAGFEAPSQEGFLKLGSRESSKEVCLRPKSQERRSGTGGRPPIRFPPAEKRQVPRGRGDGWMEVLIGEFFLNEGINDGEVEVSFREIRGNHSKRGLVVQSIEIISK